MRLEVVGGLEDLEPHREAWDRLAAAQGLGPAHTYDWIRTLSEVHWRGRPLEVAVVWDGGRPVGIAPFRRDRIRRMGIGVRTLSLLNSFYGVHGSQLLVGVPEDEVLGLLLEHAIRGGPGWDLWTSIYRTGEAQARAFEAATLRAGLSHRTSPGDRSPYLPIEGSWEQYLATRPKKVRWGARRFVERLETRGPIRLRILEGPRAWEEGAPLVLEIERQSWKTEAGTALTEVEHQQRFYEVYGARAASRSLLRLAFLTVGDEPVAYDYAIAMDGVYYLLKQSYKSAWRDLSPGTVSRQLVLEWLFQNGFREIDFLGKDELHKMKWTNRIREHVVYHVYGRTPTGGLLYLRRILGDVLRRR